jgi:uncharacterized protein (TIGR00369 family)
MAEAWTREQIQETLMGSPCIAFLQPQVEVADVARQELTVYIPFRPEFERRAGTAQWHGGPMAMIVDTVGDYALAMLLRRPLPTINFSIDYLRPAIKTGLRATARVRRHGKSVGYVDVDVFDDKGSLVAIGRACYSTLE